MRAMARPLLLAVALSAAPALAGSAVPDGEVRQTFDQFGRLPMDDIWWTVMGPDMRWNNLNLQRFVPTVTLRRAGPVRALPLALDPRVGAHTVATAAGPQSLDAFLESEASTTMALLILHRGRVVYERYPDQQPLDKPLFWSVTKAYVATVVALLEAQGRVDVSQAIDQYIPALKGSAYAGVPVRDILDMASGVDCGDEYEDQDSCYYRYSAAIGEGFRKPGSPDNPYDYVAGLPPDLRFAEPGESFTYSGVDTFVLGWLVEAVTGQGFAEVLSREVWERMGAEADGLIWAGRYGIPLTSGGLMATVRDVARFGLLFTPSRHVVSDQAIIPASHVQTLLHGGRPELLTQSRWGDIRRPGVRHNVYQWDTVYDNDDVYKGGWAGQGLLINPTHDLVAVWTGFYRPDGTNEDVLPMVRQVFQELYGAAVPASNLAPATHAIGDG